MTDVSVTIQETPLAVVVDTGTPRVTITEQATGNVTVTQAAPVTIAAASGSPRIFVNNGGAGSVPAMLESLIGKLTRTHMDPALASDLDKLQSLWLRIGNELILTYPDGLSIQEAGRSYTNTRILDTVSDINISVDGKVNIAFSSVDQKADSIDQRVTQIKGDTDNRMLVAESRILQTEQSITQTVSRMDTIDGPGGAVELLQSAITQTANSVTLEASRRQQVADDLVEARSAISVLTDTITLMTTTLNVINGWKTDTTMLLGEDGIEFSVLQTLLNDTDYSIGVVQSLLANKWGVEISEDVAGRKYASGFSLLLHPIWLNGQAYTVGDTVAVGASVYRCIVSHTADATNSPTGAAGTTYWLLLPEGVKSSFIVRADQFAVMGPDGSGDALMPFTVDIVDGQAVVGIHGQLIVGGSLPFNALSEEAQTTINNSITTAEAQALLDAQTYADGKFVTQVLHQAAVDNLQGQLDGQVIAWFYDYAPTLNNAPASLWTTEALRDQHANDTFTHLTTGQSWRWVYDTGAWKWLEIADTATTAALAAASQAQDTADNKRRVFTAQPTVPYDIGDLWTDGTTLLRCVTPKTSTGSYAVGDWLAVADKTNYANTETFPAVVTPTRMKRTGSTFEKVGGTTGADAQAYSLQGYTGGCRLAFKSGYTNRAFLMGITLNPTIDAAYANIDYQFCPTTEAFTRIYEKAAIAVSVVGPYTTDTLFEIIYDGSEVRYMMDGVVKRTVTGLASGLTFYMDSSFYSAGSKATHVQWGPYSPPLSVVQARAELARTTAQAYADGEITAAEQRAIAEAQAKADLAEANANAYADGKVTAAEQRAIDAAQAKADLAEMNAKAWADGIVTAEEQRAIQDAQAKADAAELAAKEYADVIVLSAEQRAALDAQAKATVAETTAKAYADGQVTAAEQRAIADAQSKALMGHNLLNWYESWVPGTGNTGQFLRNSSDAENMRALATGPFGQREIVWQSIPPGDGGADGGFNTLAPTGGFSVDPDKTYIYGCYMQRLTGNGMIYLGCFQVKNLSGVVNRNPYFTSTSLLNSAKWMLAIGVIHPRGYTGPDTGMSGFYDVETGAKLVAGTDFKIDDTLADPTVQRMRAFQYYSTTGDGVTVEAQFARPFVMEASVCPPIDQLTGKLSTIAAGADVTDYTTIYANTETFPAVLTPDVMKRTGSTFEKIGGVAGWNAQAYSLQGYTGGCRLAFKAGGTTFSFMVGINTDPATDASYTSVDYQFQYLSTGLVTTYQGATQFSIGSPSYTTDTLFEIIYDGSEIRYLMDGVVKRTVTGLDAGLTFYMDLSFATVGSKATHVQWGPYAPPLSVVKALALAAETEAKSFADGIVTAEEQRAIADAQAKANAAQAAAEGNAETFPAAITPDLMIRRGSTFERVAGSDGWLSQAYSANKYTGGCRVAFRAGSVGKAVMLGINADPTLDTSYASIDYCFFLKNDATVIIYESGVIRSIGAPAYTTNTLFEIIYDGAEVRYLMDGVVVRTVTGLANNLTFYMDSSFYEIGSKVTHVEWGPYGPTLSVTQTLASTAEANAKSYADGKFVTQVLHQTDISNLQSQVDGQVSAWFYSYAPTTANAPASSWTTVALKEQHADDTFTRIDTGQSWRWVNTAGVWGWTEIADTATVTALAAAAQAQDTADNKRRVFVATPTVPYDIGDLWTTGSTISRCVTAKTTAGSYAAGDWVAVADATNYDDYRVSNVKTENNVTTIARPVGGTYYINANTITGAIKINLPQSWSNTMMKFGVDIRQYTANKSFTLHLGGYNNVTNAAWQNGFAQLTGSTASNNRVRFGHDGTKCCILIGDVSSVWSYPSVVVKDFQASYSNMTRDKWETGWAISIVTSVSGITTTADISDTLIDAKSILGQGALATQNTADYGTQVTGTKPPANADSTTTVIGAGLITTGYIGNKAKTDPLLTLGINFDTAEILVGAAAGLKVKSGGGILVEGGGGITVDSGGGITIKDGGAISMEAGGDLVLTAGADNPSAILFKRAPDDTNPIRLYGSLEDAYATTLTVASELEDTTSVYLGLPTNKLRNIFGTSRGIQFNVGKTNEGLVGLQGNSVSNSYVEITATGAYIGEYRPRAVCKCILEDNYGTALLSSSTYTRINSDANIVLEAPNITITGSNGTKISAPIRTTNPTASEVPNNQVMIYTVGTATRLAANINGTMYIRTL